MPKISWKFENLNIVFKNLPFSKMSSINKLNLYNFHFLKLFFSVTYCKVSIIINIAKKSKFEIFSI